MVMLLQKNRYLSDKQLRAKVIQYPQHDWILIYMVICIPFLQLANVMLHSHGIVTIQKVTVIERILCVSL